MIRNGIIYYIKKVAKETRVSYDSRKMENVAVLESKHCVREGVEITVRLWEKFGGCTKCGPGGRCSLWGNCSMEGVEMVSLERLDHMRRGDDKE